MSRVLSNHTESLSVQLLLILVGRVRHVTTLIYYPPMLSSPLLLNIVIQRWTVTWITLLSARSTGSLSGREEHIQRVLLSLRAGSGLLHDFKADKQHSALSAGSRKRIFTQTQQEDISLELN